MKIEHECTLMVTRCARGPTSGYQINVTPCGNANDAPTYAELNEVCNGRQRITIEPAAKKLTQVIVERDVLVSRREMNHDYRSGGSYRVDLVGVGQVWGPCDSLRVSVEGSASELASFDANKRIRFSLVGEAPSTKAPDLLTQAATKAKTGDVKEAVRLAVEALQKMAEGK